MSAALVVSRGLAEGTVIPLEADRYVLGRNPDCSIVLPFNAVSREHAFILRIHGKLYLEDNRSRNGTFLNEAPVTSRVQLRHNDKLRICDFQATYIDPPLGINAGIESVAEHDSDTPSVEATIAPSTLLEAQPADKLRGLLEISSSLSKTLELDALLPQIAESLFQLFRQADRCFLIQADLPTGPNEKPRMMPRLVKTRKPQDETKARYSRNIVQLCLQQRQALLLDDALNDARVQMAESVSDLRIRSVMCVPLLRADGQPFGVIQLDTLDRGKKFRKDDLELLMGVANQASISLENARLLQEAVQQAKIKRDLEVAREVQMSFLPSELPTVSGYQCHAYYQPANSIGGDYYGFIPLQNGRMIVSLGDVAGKGIPAALLMAKLSSEMSTCALTVPDPAEMVNRLNDLMYPFTNPMQRFVTLSLMLLESTSHQHTLVSAGHPPPLVYDPATSTFTPALTNDDGGLPMGVMEGYPYGAIQMTLKPGEILLLFSDGLTDPENMKDEPFGLDGVFRSVQGLGATNPRTLVETIVRSVQRHAAGKPPFDDITILAIQRTA